ncbi:hypothetical protein [Psychromicrobium sp. YIM B11713]|uniref:hypothetical protein n=1 Tax=Psychromicrobium sp. YIM B11713 TaxID=3145233 RepID=UPI00374F2245
MKVAKFVGKVLAIGMTTVIASVALSGVGVAQASSIPDKSTPESALTIVNKVTQKSPEVLPKNAVTSNQQTIVGALTLKSLSKRPEDVPLAGIAAVDKQNSVIAKGSDAQSLITVLHSGTSKADFKISIPNGFKPSINADGSIKLVNGPVSMPFVKAPWALDATGKKLSTSYTVSGDLISQHVDTTHATFPIVADPSIQWIPYPIVAMWGYQAEAVGRVVGTIMASSVGGGCVLSMVGGIPGKIFSIVCGLIGAGGAKDVMQAIGNLWSKQSHYSPYTCYGFPIYNPWGAGVTVQPMPDCQ